MTPVIPSVAGTLVFFTSAAVLILEILAARLLAPYVGVTLETYTGIIGTVLAGISIGTWIGGRIADRRDPRAMLGPLLVSGGGLSLATIPLVRLVGDRLGGAGPMAVVALSVVGFFAPAAVLSAVAPAVVKLQLRDLRDTGKVVGRLSALGTAGAIAGTFFAGFVLVEVAPTTTSILVVGASLMAAGAAIWLYLSTNGIRLVLAVAAVAGVGTALGAAAGDPCDVETIYHCARVIADDQRPGGRLLMLDTLRHSYVDLDDPTHLEFRYTKVIADVIAATAPLGPLDAVHIGGGGFTLPRYLRAVRPGSTNLVLEIDPGLVKLSRERLGLRTGDGIDVRVGDARLLVASLPRAGYDVAVGDAFGGLAVPWHLTTVELAEAVRALLRPGGVYVVNVIDYPPMRFARAEAATLEKVFGHVAVIAPPESIRGDAAANFVLAASSQPLDTGAIARLAAARRGEEEVVAGAAAESFVDGARPLTDDHAPVDQWLARARLHQF
jgi:spermidine synthase